MHNAQEDWPVWVTGSTAIAVRITALMAAATETEASPAIAERRGHVAR
jgi:hypothetical protein